MFNEKYFFCLSSVKLTQENVNLIFYSFDIRQQFKTVKTGNLQWRKMYKI